MFIEEEIVRDAIAMVASGGSQRVTVAGLTFGRQLLAEATEFASTYGVVLCPLIAAGSGCDIVVEAAWE